MPTTALQFEEVEFRALLKKNDLKPVFRINNEGIFTLAEGVTAERAAEHFARLVTAEIQRRIG